MFLINPNGGVLASCLELKGKSNFIIMKQVLTTLLANVIIGSVSLAQSQHRNPKHEARVLPITHKHERMRKELALTNAQFGQVMTIHKNYSDKVPNKPENQLTAKEKSAINKLRYEEETAIVAVLTPRQRVVYQQKPNRYRTSPIQGAETSPKGMQH